MDRINHTSKFRTARRRIRTALLLTVLTGSLCFSGCGPAENADPKTDPPVDVDPIVSEDSIMTMAIFSDVHIGKKNTRPEEKFTHALKQLSKLAPKLDAVAFGGDITDRGTDEEYREFMKILNAHTGEELTKIYCMGNHEYFRDGIVRYGGESKSFLEECQNAYKENICKDLDTDTVVNGVHVISVSARNSAADYAACEEFLISRVEAAAAENPDMPIIIIAHEGAGSFFEGGCGGYTSKTVQTLKKYPQIIFFSGHTHFALQDPRLIQQDAYTNVQTSTVGADFWNYSFEAEDQPKDAASASQGLFLKVMKDGTVELIRYDYTNNQTIGQVWKVDSKNFTYDSSQRKKLAERPVFAADAVLEISDAEGDHAVLKFPAAAVNDMVSDGIIYTYKIRITDKATGKIAFHTSMMSDYYMGAAAKDAYTFSISGLTPGTEYTATVTAASVFDKRSEPLKLDFVMPE